ncbi:response regulator transcription factor [Marichromatium bheemlicum]|uniref:Response regulator transcription factor n=1 Tax=Marichromatium bheemlicum TaxID=365339 RepID=A0ABX1I5J3_9GAMM|nr:response regulator transcription factor [Marichromatium bheemlicum]NKN32453.1 response regulator transcription factor [Marichromatium bheemlicum]
MTEPTCVILIEGDAELRATLSAALEEAGCAVTTAGDAVSGYRQLNEQGFAVVIVGLALPDQPGQVLIDYTRRNTASAVVALGQRGGVEVRVDCYRAGADLFLQGPVDPEELAAAVSSLTRRYAQLRASAPRFVGWRLLVQRRALAIPGAGTLELSPRECQLLDLLSPGAGEAVRRCELLDRLYARRDESAERALETLVRRTRRKIAGHHPGPSPILTQHGVGYAFATPLMRA